MLGHNAQPCSGCWLCRAGVQRIGTRPGDVTAAVPEPQTWALTMLALGAAIAVRRRRAA